jgi:hypothetical protein
MKRVYKILFRKREGKIPLGRARNGGMILGLGWESLYRIFLAHGRDM